MINIKTLHKAIKLNIVVKIMLKIISNSLLILTVIAGVSKGVQLESKNIVGSIVGKAIEGVKNGPVGSALMIPVSFF